MENLTKINKILIFILSVFALLHFGASFLVPLLLGGFLASLMVPFSNWLETSKIHRLFAALISTFVVFIVVGGLLFLFIFQADQFVSDIGSIKSELHKLMDGIEKQITAIANITAEEQKNFWEERSFQVLNRIESVATDFFSGFLNVLSGLLIILIYVFLLLLYRARLYKFIMMYTPDNKKDQVQEIMAQMSTVVYHHLWGRVKVMSVLAIMYYATFLIFGLPYALLLTIFGALITIIPYLGPLISGVIPIIFSFLFLDSIAIAVIFSIIVIIEQLIESYVLEPWIIGKEVKLNPLVVIVAIILGGMVWGLAGMILFVPLFAIVKIISNNTPGLKPVGFLLGHNSSLQK